MLYAWKTVSAMRADNFCENPQHKRYKRARRCVVRGTVVAAKQIAVAAKQIAR
jgi:hypothetical protein